MFYALDDKISKAELAGGLPITAAEYSHAKSHMMRGGLVKVWGGTLILTEKPEKIEGHHEPEWKNGAWHHEPEPVEVEHEPENDSSGNTAVDPTE